jgi:hypothetical protein
MMILALGDHENIDGKIICGLESDEKKNAADFSAAI